MDPIQLGIIGCGANAMAHLRAIGELWEKGIRPFRVAAACDIAEGNASRLANAVEAMQGTRPAEFGDLSQLLNPDVGVQAVYISTVHSKHHDLAVSCLEEGIPVLLEKPLSITMRAGRLILEAATQSGQLLAVAENYRRALQERARCWAIRHGWIGKPRTFYWQDVGERLQQVGWRDSRMVAGGGWILDVGVHFADLFRYHLGAEAREVYAITRQYEPFRYGDPAQRRRARRVDVDDAVMAMIRFDGDVMVQWTWQASAPGQGFGKRILYGSEGSLDWELGWCPRQGEIVDNDTLVKEYMQSLSADDRERLYPAGITNTMALEMNEFATVVRDGVVPEIDGVEGYKAQAICMGILESAHGGVPVQLQEVEDCELEGYQRDINTRLEIN